MRKIIYLLLFPVLVVGQSTDQNYIKTTVYKVGTPNSISNPDPSEAHVAVDYFDGLGRPIQHIERKASNINSDIYTHIEYDEYGRQIRKYLPYMSPKPNTDLVFDSEGLTSTMNFYQSYNGESTPNPYEEKFIEASPIDRLLKEAAPGEIWAGNLTDNNDHTIKYNYDLNGENEVKRFAVKRGDLSNGLFDNKLTFEGYYKPSLLYKITIKDEDWKEEYGNKHTITEYRDVLGRVILKRKYEETPEDTYYIYDAIGNLCYVIPPMAEQNVVSLQSSQTPYVYHQSIQVEDVMLNSTGQPINGGGGGIYIDISSGNITVSFNGGWDGQAHIDVTKDYPIYALYPIPDMTIGNLDINYTGNHQYWVYIENNELKFLDLTPSTPPFDFHNFDGQTLTQPLAITFPMTTEYTGIIDDAIIQNSCYLYKYDTRNRLCKKKIPGKDTWEYIVYDRNDRPVLNGPTYSPFGNNTLGWSLTKYDRFGRIIYTGWAAIGADEGHRADLQSQKNGTTQNLYETKTSYPVTIDGIPVDYTNDSFITQFNLLTVNYYDDYVLPNLQPNFDQVLGEDVVQIAKDMQTGSWVRVLDPSAPYANISYTLYDERFRPVQNCTQNYLGGYTKQSTKLDFSGKTLYTVTEHKRLDTDEPLTVTDSYTYTGQDQLLTDIEAIDGSENQLILHNTYDGLGKLITKNVGGNDFTDFNGLQKVDYKYNIRGWLKSINDTSNLEEASFPTDLFAFRINYNDPQDETGSIFGDETPACYNGDISETYWRSKSDNVLRKYAYNYDSLNRLKDATYEKPGGAVLKTHAYDENLTYDINGNVTKLDRTGELDDPDATGLVIDNLTYEYDSNSNRLKKVYDTSNSPAGFHDDSNGFNDANDDYLYDELGNMTKDENKMIDLITHNHLNQPVEITFHDGRRIAYLYDAAGTKFKKTVFLSSAQETTDYIDGFQYLNQKLSFFPHAEGYVNVINVDDNRFYNYVFNFTDHLGNIRMSWAYDGKSNSLKILEENHYYPYGLRHRNYNMERKDFEKQEDILRPVIKPLEEQDKKLYKYKFSGKEWQDDLGLNTYDYGFRQYMPDIARMGNVDMLAELAYDLTPNRYSLNNPITFTDPSGLWEVIPGGYTTKDPTDIKRFYSYLNMELAQFNNIPTFEQKKTFIDGEMSKKGHGQLSDGSLLADEVVMTMTRKIGGGAFAIPNFNSLANFWRGVQRTLTPDALDPFTLNRQFHGILGPLTYPGPDNPKTYAGDDDYTYVPTRAEEFPAITHDLAYDHLGIRGSGGLFTEPRAIRADYTFVAQELTIALLSPNIKTKRNAAILGVGLGVCALPKTLKVGIPILLQAQMQGAAYYINNFRMPNLIPLY